MPDHAPRTTSMPAKYRLPLFLTLVMCGLAGNYFKYPIFLNIDFLFGSIFAILALQIFGVAGGVPAAAVIASYTYVLWNHPYAIIIMTAEVAAVGWLVKRRGVNLVLADALYWLFIGMPLVYLFYRGFMHTPFSSVHITMTKQAMNGIANVLVARIIYTGYLLYARSALVSYREIVYNMLAFFVIFPALIFLMVSSRNDFSEMVSDINNSIIEAIDHEHFLLDDWAEDREKVAVHLARLAMTKTPRQMQEHLDQASNIEHDFLEVGLLDTDAAILASSPKVDDHKNSSLGNFEGHPLAESLKELRKPMLSEIVMSSTTPTRPIVKMLAPIVVNGGHTGYVYSVLNTDHIKEHFDASMNVENIFYTLLDRNGSIIMTNRADQKVMTAFNRGKGTYHKIDGRTGQWVPHLPANTPMSERWKNSMIVAEVGIGGQDEWRLILEKSVAPHQKHLFERYANRLSMLLLLLAGVLFFSEIVSRKSVRSLEQLNQITRHLPKQIFDSTEITWPESNIQEVNTQISNSRETAAALGQQFREIIKINSSLEERVEERTRALAESELFFRESQRAAFIGSYKLDYRSGRWESSEVLDSIYGIDTGYSRTIQGWLDLVHPDDRDAVAGCLSREFIARSHSCVAEFRIMRRFDGELRWVAGSGGAVLDDAGVPVYLIGTIQDITDRKLEQQKLEQSESKISQLMQSTAQGIYGTDLNGLCTFINNAGQMMLGYSLEECLGRNMHLLVHHTRSDGSPYPQEECRVYCANLVASGCRHDDEVLWRKDGASFPVEYSSHPIVENGSLAGVVVAFTDITERKGQEKEKQLLEQQFQEAQKYECFGVLASGIAHDFNNILAIIMGQCTLIKLDPYYLDSHASEIEKAAVRGAELCRQLLTYSGRVKVFKSHFDLCALVADMVDLLKSTLSQNIQIHFDCISTTPSVYGDPSQIRQIVMNLIINASEAIGSERGAIKVSVADVFISEGDHIPDFQRRNINPGEYVCLEVVDTGCGMNEETVQRIFEPFYTTKSTGRGLGTSAIYGAVKAHDGSIILNSVLGEGTTFSIYFPADTAADVADQTPAISFDENWRCHGTVLVADDEDAILMATSYMLRGLGLKVIEAGNGREALELYRQSADDIVLLLTDIGMPEMNGQELIREVRKICPQLPIIFSSGYGDSELRAGVEQDGTAQVTVLNKPYSFEELRAAMKEALGNRGESEGRAPVANPSGAC